MRESLCVVIVGLILLFTTLTEGSTFHHRARKQSNLKTPLGKYIAVVGVVFSQLFLHHIAYCSCSHYWWMSYTMGYTCD